GGVRRRIVERPGVYDRKAAIRSMCCGILIGVRYVPDRPVPRSEHGLPAWRAQDLVGNELFDPLALRSPNDGVAIGLERCWKDSRPHADALGENQFVLFNRMK